jgi:hypothetical protein
VKLVVPGPTPAGIRRIRERLVASDPGLLRLMAGLRTAIAIGLTLVVLATLGADALHLVVGAMAAMVSTFAVSDRTVRGQAITLALGLPTALVALSMGALLHGQIVAGDLAFLAVICGAVYVRRFGDRTTALGMISFQLWFVSVFAGATPDRLPLLYATLALAFAASAFTRLVLVPDRPESVLRRLRQAFRARLAQTVAAQIVLLRAAPGDLAEALDNLRQCIARQHEAAMMVQGRLSVGTPDQATAASVQRRVVNAEVAAERLSLLLVTARSAQRPNPVVLRLPGAPIPALARPSGQATEVTATLAHDLNTLRTLVSDPDVTQRDPGFTRKRDRLLDYRGDEHIPAGATPAFQDVFHAVGELTREVLGLRMVLDTPQDQRRDSPAATRSRAEFDAEDASIADAEQQAAQEITAPARLRRPTTRTALQVTFGSALAMAGGEYLSSERWYWAVLTCWIIFVNTASTGEIVVKGYRRLLGTVLGVVAGMLLAVSVDQHVWPSLALVLVFVFAMFYTAPVSYTAMSFCVTSALGLLYSLLHTYSVGLLVLRIEETALGATCGILAAMLVLPVHTDQRTDDQLVAVLRKLGGVVTAAIAQLGDRFAPDVIDTTRELDDALTKLRSSTQPLTHPITPLRERRETARYVVALLETAAYHARSLATTAELVPEASTVGADPRLASLGRRIAGNLDVLVAHVDGENATAALEPGPGIAAMPETGTLGLPAPHTLAFRVLRHLQRVDESVIALARPLNIPLAPRN